MTRTRPLSLLLFVLCIPIVVAASAKSDDDSYWVEPMNRKPPKYSQTKKP